MPDLLSRVVSVCGWAYMTRPGATCKLFIIVAAVGPPSHVQPAPPKHLVYPFRGCTWAQVHEPSPWVKPCAVFGQKPCKNWF